LGAITAPTLETPRLILRALSLDDWEAYATAWADARLTTFIGGEPRDRTTSWGKFLQGIGLWPLFGYGYWSFIESETGQFVGNGGLARFERGLPELEGLPEAGWAFVPDAWGKGYATEAMAAILDWADRSIDATEIRCIVDPGNIASHRVATKLGFEQFATSDKPLGPINIYRRMAP
jgi:RimJ/RimL family protein N-acetyltransferase